MIQHQDRSKEKSFILSLGLTSITFLFELVGGILTGSLALISDSAHVFLDVFALGISYLALRISTRPADDTHSYGFHRLEVLAALTNGITLLAISFGIFYEAWERWLHPADIKPIGMLWIAILGLVINVIVARVLHGHQHTHLHGEHEEDIHDQVEQQDLNVHSAYQHVIGDAISSVGVILAAILIYFTGWTWVDPLMSVVIGIIILTGSFRVLKASLHILNEGVPDGIRISEVKESIKNLDGVQDIHDLHIWNICSGNIAMSAHILVDENNEKPSDEVITGINQLMQRKYHIQHTTIQIEKSPCVHDCG